MAACADVHFFSELHKEVFKRIFTILVSIYRRVVIFFLSEALHSFLDAVTTTLGVTHLVYLDSFDGALAGDASKIIQRFQDYQCELLVAAKCSKVDPSIGSD